MQFDTTVDFTHFFAKLDFDYSCDFHASFRQNILLPMGIFVRDTDDLFQL